MCNFAIDVRSIERDETIEFAEYFAEDLRRLREHEKEGLVSIGAERIEATPNGELFIRNLAMCFDRYRREKPQDEEHPLFSRTV